MQTATPTLYTGHCHQAAPADGLRQCSCGAWTMDGQTWAASPETLFMDYTIFLEDAEDRDRVATQLAQMFMPDMTIETSTAAALQPA